MNVHPQSYAAYDLFHKGVLALARAEQQGIRVDVGYIENKKRQLTRKIAHKEDMFKETKLFHNWQHSTGSKPVNIYSNAQLSHYLYGVKKIRVQKETASGQGATDEEALKQLGIPELDSLLEIRKLKKVRDTYLESFAREQVNGILHPFFNLHLVRTYRSSSDSPNFQNIPIRDEESMQICRGAIMPRPGHQLLEVDYSAIEVKVAACYTQDPVLLKYVRDPKSDMHGDIAKEIYMIVDFNKKIAEHSTLKQSAKNGFIFPEFYGDYYKACAQNMACNWGKLSKYERWKPGQGISMPEGTLSDLMLNNGFKSLSQFEVHVKKIETEFWEKYEGYKKWQEKWYNAYLNNGYIDTLTGFRCWGPMEYKHTINYPIQGSAFHCLLWSFIQTDEIMYRDNWDSKLWGQIHDSMLLDVLPEELKMVTQAIHKITCEDLPKAWKWIIAPMEVEMKISPVDCSWAEQCKYELN